MRVASAWVVMAGVTLFGLTACSLTACGRTTDPDIGVGAGAGGVSAGTAGTGGSSASGGIGGVAIGGNGGSVGVLCPPDEDGDDIPDEVEGKATARDTDADGTPDYQDADSDDDTIPDQLEADAANLGCNTPRDSDGDGTPNHLDSDSDNNGVDDRDEIYPGGGAYDSAAGLSDVDSDGQPDPFDPDNDGDGLDDIDEIENGGAADTDGDGLPDFDEIDSDGDGIGDGFEGFEDTDGDGKRNYQDLDSDKDGILDACEKGQGTTPTTPPDDNDADGKFDAYDIDSDNDGLLDGLEDINGDCVVNAGETNRILADTDGDGVSDRIEVTVGSDPTDGADTPQSSGRYVFMMPYQGTPEPAAHEVVLSTKVNKADVALVIEATDGMGGAIDNLVDNLPGLAGSLSQDVTEARLGVAGVQDYPYAGYGSATSEPVFVPLVPQGYLTATEADSQAALSALSTTSGLDSPEAMVAGLLKVVDDRSLTWPGGSQAPFSPGGDFGGLGFRADALPILVMVSGAAFHNGRRMACSDVPFEACKLGCCSVVDPTLRDPYGFAAPNGDDLAAALTGRGAKLIGIALNAGGAARTSAPYPDMAYYADQTKSYVSPSAFTGTGSECLTDHGGGVAATDGPELGVGGPRSCRLVFASPVDGSEVSTGIASGVRALLSGLQVSVRLGARQDTAPPVVNIDAIEEFIDYIEVLVDDRVQDPAAPGQFCDLRALPPSQLDDVWADNHGVTPGSDSHLDTVKGVSPRDPATGAANRVCFRVVPKQNQLVPQTSEVQVVRVILTIQATNDGQAEELVLGEPRELLFVIPPEAA